MERDVTATLGQKTDSARAVPPLTIEQKVREYIQHVPLYRAGQKFLSPSMDARAVLAALPPVTKADIKNGFPGNFLRAGQSLDDLVAKGKVEIEHTAGTTDNRADLLLEYGWWLRQERWALSLNSLVAEVLEKNPQPRRVTLSSPACNGEITFNGTPSAKRRSIGNTRFLSLSRFPFLLAEDDLDRMIKETQEWDPLFLDTDPVYATVFALHCERRGVRFPNLKFILTTYEYCSVLHTRILRRVFGVPVYNLYGSTETGHLLMENDAGEMVPSPTIAHLDVVNTDSRGIGELAVSTLTNDYMPLLNYRIGDLVQRRVAPGADGRPRETYVLHGRGVDTLKSRGGDRLTTREVDQCFVDVKGIAHYRLHEIAPGKFVLNYVAEPIAPTRDHLERLIQKLTALIGPGTEIQAAPVKYLLPESSGKFVLNYPYLAQS